MATPNVPLADTGEEYAAFLIAMLIEESVQHRGVAAAGPIVIASVANSAVLCGVGEAAYRRIVDRVENLTQQAKEAEEITGGPGVATGKLLALKMYAKQREGRG